MSNNNHTNHFDPQLSALFEREHTHLPEEPFVTTTMAAVRKQRRALVTLGNALRITVLVILVVASPWLIAAAASLNEVLESSLAWIGNSAGWLLALLATGAVLAMRVRSR